MGRPRSERPTTSKERMQKLRQNEEKRAAANARRREARLLRKDLNQTPEELEIVRANARIRQEKCRTLKKETNSRQKNQGQRMKERNRKRKMRETEVSSPAIVPPSSAERTRLYRERMKVNVRSLCSSSKKRNTLAIGKSVATALKPLSPAAKSRALEMALTPNTKKYVHDSYNKENGSGLGLFNQLSKRRDNLSNCTRKLVLGKLSLNKRAARANWTSVQRAVSQSIPAILVHYKTEKTKKQKPPTETQKLVHEFYNRDDISRMLPYKKLTRRVKDYNGNYQRVAVRVMEVTLKRALSTFKNLHPGVKICRRSFESLRPKNIRLTRYAQRLQCGCTYHTNVDYARKSLHRLLLLNGKESPISSNELLMGTSLCDAKSFKCIMGRCKNCKSFPKLDNLITADLKCCKDCIKKDNDCKTHTVKVRQFERVVYQHKGKEKKKMALVDKWLTAKELIELLKSKLIDFPRHRFNVAHTSEIYDEIVSQLDDETILKIHDFSENYTCLLPEEIQSLHWTQETATVYPVVILRRVAGDVREDHITFISDDKKHDVPFVEKCNEWMHEHYRNEGVNIKHDVEYNDGCSSQFKCIRAFSGLARRDVKTTRIFCETSHGKSKSDGLGGVVKCCASRCVCSEKRVMRDAKELFEFFQERLVVTNAIDSNKPMLNRIFHYISSEEMEGYRSTFPSINYKYIHGTLQIHQVITSPGDSTHIWHRNVACTCASCLAGTYTSCNRKSKFSEISDMITLKKHVFSKSYSKRKSDLNDDDDEMADLNDDEMNELESAEFMESEASKLIQNGDIAVIKTGDDHPYYLLKLTKESYETEELVKDDYGHDFPPQHRVVEGHYLEIHKTNKEGDLYYLDENRTAIISAFAVVGNCTGLETSIQRRRGNLQEMFLVTPELHQGLCEIVNYLDI